MENHALTALATAGIQLAQTAVLTVFGALIVFAVAVYGTKKVLELIKGKRFDPPEIGNNSFDLIEGARMRANERLNQSSWDNEFRYSGNRDPFPTLDLDFQNTKPFR